MKMIERMVFRMQLARLMTKIISGCLISAGISNIFNMPLFYVCLVSAGVLVFLE